MEEINLKELFEYYLNKIPIILLTMMLTALIGYAYVEYIQVPYYNGTTTIILVQKNEEEENELYNNTENQIAINEKLVTTYSEIIKSRRVLNQVIDQLNLRTTLEKLTKKIEVKSISNTSIIQITVKDKNNKKAANIANSIADIFKEEITQIYNLENVSIIDKAIAEKKPYNVNEPFQIIIASLFGFIVAIIIIFIMYYFDNSLKDKKEIEEKLNLPVLGEIPYISKLNKKKKKESKKQIKSRTTPEATKTQETNLKETVVVATENKATKKTSTKKNNTKKEIKSKGGKTDEKRTNSK